MKPRAPASFTLTEILTATAVLSLLFTIMFGILQQTSLGWQAANRRVEASQAARLALEQIVADIENSVVVTATQVPTAGLVSTSRVVGGQTVNFLTNRTTNYAFGFIHSNQPAPSSVNWLGESGVAISEPNDLLFLTVPHKPSLNMRTRGQGGSEGRSPGDLAEVGYIPVFISSTRTVKTMLPGRFVLMRHQPLTNISRAQGSVVSFVPNHDFLSNAATWFTTPENLNNTTRLPFVDNCIRFNVQFRYAVTNALGQVVGISNSPTWGRPVITGTGNNAQITWQGNPPGASGLPLAADITLSVLDERSAERLHRLSMAANAGRITNAIAGDLRFFPTNWTNPTAIQATLMQGAITFQRRAYFRQTSRTNL